MLSANEKPISAMSFSATAYDSTPYPSHVYPETHPDHLAAVGTLFGMDPPPVEHSRVLDVGCGDAGNLIAMAYGLPSSNFVGIDLAGEPINAAQRIINHAGLTNSCVRQMDLMDLNSELGQFDYIIAHGFYSWVPTNVQEKLLKVCQQHLSPQGIAFISYNVFPAGRIREASRELMLFHLERSGSKGDRVSEGKTFLKFIVDSIEGSGIWKNVLQQEVTRLSKRDDAATFHDELGPVYSPVYFSKFIESGNKFGLQFVSEANIRDTLNPPAKEEVLRALKDLSQGNLIAYHQYLDFILFRGFRRTVLCRNGIELQRVELAKGVMKLWVASPLVTSGHGSDGEIHFSNPPRPGILKTNNHLLIAALRHLENQWPRAERFNDLLSASSSGSSESRAVLGDALAEQILTLTVSGLIELRTYSPALAGTVSERPLASPLARIQARDSNLISTLLHTNIEVKDDDARRLLQLLDGTRDESSLSRSMLKVHPRASVEEMEAQVRTNLVGFHRAGLLVS